MALTLPGSRPAATTVLLGSPSGTAPVGSSLRSDDMHPSSGPTHGASTVPKPRPPTPRVRAGSSPRPWSHAGG
eukprot:8774234-Alexandrium_andersonii.AAC.1